MSKWTFHESYKFCSFVLASELFLQKEMRHRGARQNLQLHFEFLKKALIIMAKQEHFEVIVKPIEDAVLAPRNRMKLSK